MSYRHRHLTALLVALIGWAAPFFDHAEAQIRVVSYNTLGKPFGGQDEAEFTTILAAIGNKSVNGIAKRVDILGLQEGELTLSNNSFTDIAAEMNSLYGVSGYQTAVVGSGEFKVGYVYDSSTVDLLSSSTFFIGTRPAHRAQFRPVGYSSTDAELYTFDVHLKAGKNGSDITTRSSESVNLKANADALGDGKNLIYMGDFNFSRSDEPGYVTLLSSGNGEGFDPLNESFWPVLSSQAHIMTQSTRTGSIGDGGATGGLDDRFDLQIVSGEMLDGEGLSYLGPTSTGLGSLDHSYQAFGNDGVSANTAINNVYVDRSQPAAVLDALHDFSDHLPVVADYQLPAIMEVDLATIPLTVNLGDSVSFDVTVENVASVLVPIAADELDYTVSVLGDLLGGATSTDLALDGGNMHAIAFDTSSLGMKSGTVMVSSSSQAVENGMFSMPINFEVVMASSNVDLDLDGDVDGTDFLAIQRTNPSLIPQWETEYSNGTLSAVAAVPEPTSIALIGLAVSLLPWMWRQTVGDAAGGVRW